MAEQKDINPALKQVLELGPALLYFVIYWRMKDNTYTVLGTEYSGLITAMLIFVPIMLASVAALWWLTGQISRIQVFTVIMVLFFGGLTAWFNDDRFFKMKTSIVYGFFSLLLGIGLMRGQSWLAFIMKDMIPMEQEGWRILTRRLCLVFLLLAIANEFVWRTMSEEAWVTIETFAFPVALMAFLFLQMMALQPYLIEDETEADSES